MGIVQEEDSYKRQNWFLRKISSKKITAIFYEDEGSLHNFREFNKLLNVETVVFLKHPVIDFSLLKNNKSIKYLIFQNTAISDISFVKDLPNLELLSLEGSQVTDFSPLENLQKLKVLL